jgi:hypothetical protein
MEKFVWENDEVFTAKMQISHHAEKDLKGDVIWEIIDENGEILIRGNLKISILKMEL